MPDCAANPNDPVCISFYGGSAPTITKVYSSNQAILAALKQGAPALTTPNPTGFISPGTSIVPTGLVVMPIPSPWYKTWWGVGLLALGAGVGYFKVIKPRLNKPA